MGRTAGRYFIFTLGCQMNHSDSERIASLLNSYRFIPSNEKEADLIVVNACSVRQSAVDRIYGKLKRWQGKKVFITGCVLPEDKKRLAPKVTKIFPITDLPKLPKWLGKKELKINHYFKIPPFPLKEQEKTKASPRSAFVPIMTGCDNFCTYCAVPYTRGRETSRPVKEIICEVKKLVKRGVEEIVLLGQNVNRYKAENQSQKLSFIELLKKITQIPGQFTVKFLTSNPWDFSEKLIELIAQEPKIAKEIHLPVQSGDDGILWKMNRPYTSAGYFNLVKKLRSKIKNLRLSTDLIVGFPGETKKAFENTVKLCQKAKFDKAYIALYSPRPGTAAFNLKDDVPFQEKKRRWQVLEQLINKKPSS